MPATKKPRASNDTVKSQMSARKKDVREQREKEKFRLWALLGVFALLVIVAVEWSNDSDDVVVGGSPSPSSASGMGGAARAGGKKNKYARPGASKKKNKYQRPGKGGGGGGGGGGGNKYNVEVPAADHTKEGIARDERGDKAGSIESFKAAAKYNSGQSSPWMNLGVACMRNQRLREAQDAYAKAEKINPKDQTLAENKKALESWIEHYGLDGDGPGAASANAGGNSGGGAKKKKNKYQRPGGGDKKKASGGGGSSAYSFDDPAAEHTKQAIEFDKKGDKEGCIKSFESAVKYTGTASDYMNLGVAYMRSRDYDKAQVAMDKANELSPSAEVQENMKALKHSKEVDPIYTKAGVPAGGKKKKKSKYQTTKKKKK